jgi:PKD repeat protein
MRTLTSIVSLALVVATTGCTTQKTEAPPLTGPSGFALQVVVNAIPDSILQDGASQASIQIDATDPDGRGVRGLSLRIETALVQTAADGSESLTFMDFGMLSAKTVVTGEDGRARATYTAPPRPAEPVDTGTFLRFFVTPIGNDYQGQQSRFATLRLVPPGVILPPNSAPVPAFTSSGNLQPFSDIVFDASTTMDDGLPCGASCTYRWEFGDGETGNGIFVKHQYKAPGTFQLRLTATDTRGASATLARPMQIGAATPPTAAFTFSPTTGIATGQTVFFNGEGSRAATGRRIVAYDWDFGSGRTGTGITTTKSYDNPGTYVVSLVVTDDIGEKSMPASQTVTVGTLTTLSASLVVTPSTSPTNAASLVTPLLFDASASRGPSPIVEYRFNFGDGSPEVVQTALPTWTYTYKAGGIYNARVTVRDATGRSATATTTVYVQ